MNAGASGEHQIIDETGRPYANDGGLYIHVPFCMSKCGYCDFYSIEVGAGAVATTMRAISEELRCRVGRFTGTISTCYVGGGTPTVVEATELASLLGNMRDSLCMDRVEEFSMEANPATVGPEKASLLAEYGVNRVCMGVQSFHANELAFLERGHCPEDIVPAIAELRDVGIGNVGVDLIFGIGGQSVDTWRESLLRAIDLGPTHISCYGLTYEPATRLTAKLRNGEIEPCDEQLEAELYLQAVDVLENSGFEHYEISNFARPGYRCRHNMVYWTHRPYLGVGPSAAGYLGGVRYRNVADVSEYARLVGLTGVAEEESEELGRAALASEMIMLQLRLSDGLDLGRLREEAGVDLFEFRAGELSRFGDAGYIEVCGERIRLTREGMLVADAIIRDLSISLEK